MTRAQPTVHKVASYTAVALGGTALISGAFQANAQIAKWQKDALQPKLEAERSMLIDNLNWAVEFECGRHFVRDEYSPPNLEAMNAKTGEACTVLRLLRQRQGAWISPGRMVNLRPLTRPPFDAKFLSSEMETVKQTATDYNNVVREFVTLERVGSSTPAETTLTIFGPFVAALALALGLATIAFPPKPASRSKMRTARKKRGTKGG
jgi:hypothetical protein